MSPESLRAARPTAPPELRARVRLIAAAEEPALRRRLPWRRISLVGVPVGLAAAAAAGLVIGLNGAHNQPTVRIGAAGTRPGVQAGGTSRSLAPSLKTATLPPSAARLQDYTATLELQVPDANAVSDRTRRALEIARRLGGTVARVDVSTSGANGSALVVMRVPTAKVTTAIDELSGLGRIVGQHVSLVDVQRRIDALRTRVRNAHGAERTRLQKQLLAEVRDAKLSTIALQLQTPAPEVLTSHGESRAHSILEAEGRVGLYLGLVGGPLLVLCLAAWLAWRGARRLAERRLLGA
jgi:hypothetical protein